jgi:hypothetical protein
MLARQDGALRTKQTLESVADQQGWETGYAL